MMNILVTGGAGYIGSVVSRRLIDTGHAVTVLDNLTRGHRQAVPREAEFVQGDVMDTPLVRDLLASRGIEAVMHFAASIEVGESMKRPEHYFRNNTSGSLSLLEAIIGSRVRRFVFSSTAAVFGEPDTVPIDEDHPLRPTNAYGESKLLVERMLDWFHRIHGLRYATLRYFNACGAMGDLGEAHSPETHLIPLALSVALGQSPCLYIYGDDYPTPDGTCIRDYIHVADLADAHVAALKRLDAEGRLIYNLGNGKGFSVREVLQAVRQVTGHPVPEEISPRRRGDPAVLVASSTRIQTELGWKPAFSDLAGIVSSAWQWHQRHPQGYASR